MKPPRIFDRTANRPLEVGLVGVGEFGASFLYRSGRAAQLQVRAGADGDVQRVVSAAMAAGFAADEIVRCESPAQAARAYESGRFVAVADAELIMELPLDSIIEATGVPEAAARVAVLAIAHGRHVGMVTKECDSVVGAALQARAAAAGVTCTPVDGDQPSLTMKLVSWARALGLEIVCAGKASEYDFVYDPETVTITTLGRTEPKARMKSLWRVPANALADCIAVRRALMSEWPHRTVPDLCELGLIANATGLMPDVPALHAPILRTLELPDAMRPLTEGGLLAGTGVVDIFNCLRRADELSFAGGVFVIVRCDDRATWKVLQGKGVPVSEDGRCALLHNPVHLLGIEAPYTLVNAAASGEPSGRFTPRVDVVARANRAIRKGEQLTLGARHAMPGFDPLLLDARPARDASPIPYYMAAGCVLANDIEAGEMLCRHHLDEPSDSILWRLRDEQDVRWLG